MSSNKATNWLIDWARNAGLACTNGYCDEPEANVPWLNAETRREFAEADGNEFGREGGTPKIAALHSSSALAVNVFDYWRKRDKAPLVAALGYGDKRAVALSFEGKFQTGVRPRAPNIDLVLRFDDGSILALESKFTEWMNHAGRKALRPVYLEDGASRWTSKGLPGVQHAADSYLTAGFDQLDVPQLLKHMLGLANQSAPWHLMLLWHRCDEELGRAMDREIESFKRLLGLDAGRFSSMTYQSLWKTLAPQVTGAHPEYAKYISERYFPQR